MLKIRDQFGVEINLGDIVTYPGRKGSSVFMRVGVLTGIIDELDWRNKKCLSIQVISGEFGYTGEFETKNKKTKISCLERLTKITGQAEKNMKTIFSKCNE